MGQIPLTFQKYFYTFFFKEKNHIRPIMTRLAHVCAMNLQRHIHVRSFVVCVVFCLKPRVGYSVSEKGANVVKAFTTPAPGSDQCHF